MTVGEGMTWMVCCAADVPEEPDTTRSIVKFPVEGKKMTVTGGLPVTTNTGPDGVDDQLWEVAL